MKTNRGFAPQTPGVLKPHGSDTAQRWPTTYVLMRILFSRRTRATYTTKVRGYPTLEEAEEAAGSLRSPWVILKQTIIASKE